MAEATSARRLPVGAEVQRDGGTHFRVWAPRRTRVEVVFYGEEEIGRRGEATAVALDAEGDGYFRGYAPDAGPGTLYRYRLDGGESFPDPASRYQPEGPHGPSRVVDPARFGWTDDSWRGIRLAGQVIYEMHIGTFTPEGTWEAAARELPELADLGVTLLEVMPIAEFAGRFGWGYDGVDLFAPTRLYGEPDDFRRFVNRAHEVGIGVILDVVYNHFGPDGCYVKQFSERYFSDEKSTDWGEAINFGGPGAEPVREFFIANAGYWIDEFHLDGLRLDATQDIHDTSDEHILAALISHAREVASPRSIVVVAENEPQSTRLVRSPERGGYGGDALWNDDFHHSAIVALTGHNEAYFTDYLGSPQEFISALRWGYLYQGQRYEWQKKRRGTPALDLPASAFVIFIQNHDQVANSARGERVHRLTDPGSYRALTALMLLGPGTPMLFQGQEFAASTPFLYFADHEPDLAERVYRGRKEFLRQFPSLAVPEIQRRIDHPADPKTFERSRLDFAERELHAPVYDMHRELLRLRREDPVFRAQRADRMHGAVLAPEAFLLRFFGNDGDDRLLIVNLGRDLRLSPAPEPLLARPDDRRWTLLWSSKDPDYGGSGTPDPDTDEGWRIPGHAALVLGPSGPGEAE